MPRVWALRILAPWLWALHILAPWLLQELYSFYAHLSRHAQVLFQVLFHAGESTAQNLSGKNSDIGSNQSPQALAPTQSAT